MAKNCPKFYSRFRIFASLPTLKYLNAIVPMVYILVEFKSSVLTKKSIWNMVKPRASTNDSISLRSLYNISAHACERQSPHHKRRVRERKTYDHLNGIADTGGVGDYRKSPEYTISLIFFEKTQKSSYLIGIFHIKIVKNRQNGKIFAKYPPLTPKKSAK